MTAAQAVCPSRASTEVARLFCSQCLHYGLNVRGCVHCFLARPHPPIPQSRVPAILDDDVSSSLSARRARFTVSTLMLSLPASSYRSVHLEILVVALRTEILKFGFVIEYFQVGILKTPIQV